MKYVLYCGQEHEFQTRIMLISLDKIQQDAQLKADLDILRRNAMETTLTGVTDGKTYHVDQLIVTNMVKDNRYGYRAENTEYSRITSYLTEYATGYGPKSWYNGVKLIMNGGSDHVKNYLRLRYRKKLGVEIVEGFLVLQKYKDDNYV